MIVKTSVLLDDNIRDKLLANSIEKIGSQERLARYLSNKLNRKIIRETVKGWKKGKHIYGWNLFIPTDVLKELCNITGSSYRKTMKTVIRYNPIWKDPEKKKYLIKERKMKTIERGTDIFLDIASILPQTTLEAKRSRKFLPLFAEIHDDSILLWSENTWNASKILINRYIKIDKLFFRACSIYFSEGVTKMNAIENGKISLGNTEPDIINTFIRFINKILINYKARYKIDMNCKNSPYNSEKIKEFWIKNIEYEIDSKKLNISERKNFGSGLMKNNGSFHFIINSTVSKPLLMNIIKASENLSLKRKNWSREFLQGLFICEGSVNNKNNILKDMRIGTTKNRERAFIKKLLVNLKINFTECKYDISIHGWENFCRIYTYEIFPFKQVNSISKEDKFITGFKNLRETRKLCKLIKFQQRKFTMKDWKKDHEMKYYNSPQSTLNWLVSRGFLEKIKNNNKVFYKVRDGTTIRKLKNDHRFLET
ncbi:MAG: LAGLIDADG family homing endonuclease [Candidatus Aenigmatarchaeota archaeon]